MPNITLVGTPQVGSAINGGDVTLTFNVTPVENDIVILYGGSGQDRGALPSEPSGYTRIALYEPGSGVGFYFGVWYKKMTASPDTTAVGKGSGSSVDGTAYGCYVLHGVDTSTPQDTAATTNQTAGTNPDCPSITTVTNNALVLAIAGSDAFDATPGTVSGYSNQYTTVGDDGQDITIAGATFEKVTAGAENPPAWGTWASGTYLAVTIALRPAAAETNTGASMMLALMAQG